MKYQRCTYRAELGQALTPGIAFLGNDFDGEVKRVMGIENGLPAIHEKWLEVNLDRGPLAYLDDSYKAATLRK